MLRSFARGSLRALSALVMLCLLVPGAPRAQVPQTISYQGSLTDSTGAPVSGPVAMTFNLYDNPDTALGLLWTETRTVAAVNGTFDVILGADPGNPLSPGLFENPLFLGIAIGGDAEMTPRQALSAAAYGFRAKTVESDTLNALPCAEGEVAKFVSGTWACALDDSNAGDVTAVVAGSGLSGGGLAGDVTLSADTSVVQSRVTGTCAAGSSIREILANGAVTCEPDTDTDTTYAAGSGLALTGTTFSVGAESISAGHIAADAVGQSEIQTGGVTSLEVLDNSLTSKDLAADSVDVSQISTGAVRSDEVLDNSLTANDLAPASVGLSELAALARGVGVNGSITVPAAAFLPTLETSNFVMSFDGYIFPAAFNTEICLVAPVVLPHGLTVTQFEVSVLDNSVNDPGPFTLKRISFATGEQAQLGQVLISGVSTAVQVFADTTIDFATVDAFNYMYQITGCIASDGSNIANVRLYGARISYN